MNYCSSCGSAEMQWRTPDGDNRPRHTCDDCGSVFYDNPKIVAGCIPVWEGKVLLCKRAIEPRLGLWTLPAGFMENGETTAQAAQRETWEEAQAQVEDLRLYTVINLPQINQVYMMFRGVLPALEFAPGAESLECKLYTEDEIPWSEIAFPTITHTLQYYFTDCRRGEFRLHFGDIIREKDKAVFVAS